MKSQRQQWGFLHITVDKFYFRQRYNIKNREEKLIFLFSFGCWLWTCCTYWTSGNYLTSVEIFFYQRIVDLYFIKSLDNFICINFIFLSQNINISWNQKNENELLHDTSKLKYSSNDIYNKQLFNGSEWPLTSNFYHANPGNGWSLTDQEQGINLLNLQRRP